MNREYVVFNTGLWKYWTGRGWSKYRKFARKFPYKHAALNFVVMLSREFKYRVERVA